MSCDRRCLDKEDTRWFGHVDCDTCPGRDDGHNEEGEPISNGEAFNRWFDENGYSEEHRVQFNIIWDAALFWTEDGR